MTNDQIRGRIVAAGRAMLGLRQEQLASEVGVHAVTISNIENAKHKINEKTYDDIRKFMSKNGVLSTFSPRNSLVSFAVRYEEDFTDDE